MRTAFPFICTLAVLLASGFGVAADGSDFTLKLEDREPPEELKEDIRAKLDPKVYIISDDEGPLYQFWFVKELIMEKIPAKPQEILSGVAHVSLLGAAIVAGDERCIDFRDDVVDPGVVTMRMGDQPQDGNHMGTAPANTFAILTPADRDESVEGFPDHDTLVEMSLEGTIAEHPPILYVQYEKKALDSYPQLTVGGEAGQVWNILSLKLPAKVGDETIEIAFELVFDGLGDL